MIKTEQFQRLNINKIIVILITILLFISCGGPKKPGVNPNIKKKYIFFPPPPAEPKFQYLKTFSTSGDVEKKQSRFFKFVAGKETKKDILIRKAHGIDTFEGIIYVCDSKEGYIVKLNVKDSRFGYLGIRGQGRLVKPVNLKIDKKNRIIYVADIGRKEVVAFNFAGDTIRVYGKMKEYSPSDVDLYENRLFICDVKKHKIHVMDINSGKLLYEIGKKGHKEGELYHPSNIVIHNKRIYISDTTNFRISVFDIDGNYIEKFGNIGDRPGNFSRNKGIDIDREGRIYVVDTAFQNVQIFDDKYRLLLFMLNPGPEKYNIYIPACVSINYDSVKYFKKYIAPGFKAEFLMMVTSNFGANKVNVYAFGIYEK